MWILYAVLGLLGLFLAVILLRAAFFRQKKQPQISTETVDFDKKSAFICFRL